MHVFLETERLILRRFTAADVDNLVELDSDPEVLRYINGGTPTPRSVIEFRILPRFISFYDRFEGYGYWAAIERVSDRFIGWFCLHPEDGGDPWNIALGYRLQRAAWGKGYATEGARALVEKAFAELDAQRVFATTYEYNRASRRVMEKAGLTLARVYRMTPEEIAAAGTFVDTPGSVWEGNDVEYALEKADWERSGHPPMPGIHHVQIAIPAGGEGAARAFYRDLLGLAEVEKPPNLQGRGGVWFRTGNLEFHLGVDPDFRPARKAHVAFQVKGLDAYRARLHQAGHVVAEDEPLEGFSRFYVADPFGNRIELLEPSSSGEETA